MRNPFKRRSQVEIVEERTGLDVYGQWIAQQLDMWGGIYGQPWVQSWSNTKTEAAPADYNGNASRLLSNGPIFTLMAVRLRLFSQVRWSYQQLRSGRPGDLFSDARLDLVNDDPMLNQHMIRDVDLAGNFYGVIDGGKVRPLRPDWVTTVADGPLEDYDTEVLGYAYFPGGMGRTKPEDAVTFNANEVIHWAPEPDPLAKWRGMSWLTPVIREIMSDSKMTAYKESFLDHAATPNMVIKLDKETGFENFQKFKGDFREEYEGTHNAYKTLFLGGGADATVVGGNFQQLDFTAVSGKGETRLANAAGVHPVVAGFSEGMQGSSLNAGNFGQARRSTADSLLHPLWVSAAGALGQVLAPPASSRFWYDARDIPFLREDAKDDAEIKATDAGAIRQLIDAGYEPDAVIDAITSGDLKRLKGNHTKLFSVQLQPAGTQAQASTPANGTAGRSTQLRLIRDEYEFIQGAEWVDVVDGEARESG